VSKFDEALRFAIAAHEGARRKGNDVPYIVHPLEVASIAASMTADEDVLCAAVLHDVVEDTPTTLEELRLSFGERVAELVASETENKRKDLPAADTWLIRKQESLEALRATQDRDVLILWLSDKLSNLRSFARMHRRQGDWMWEIFNQKDPAQHAWYFRQIAEATSSLADEPAWLELTFLIDDVFAEGAGHD